MVSFHTTSRYIVSLEHFISQREKQKANEGKSRGRRRDLILAVSLRLPPLVPSWLTVQRSSDH